MVLSATLLLIIHYETAKRSDNDSMEKPRQKIGMYTK